MNIVDIDALDALRKKANDQQMTWMNQGAPSPDAVRYGVALANNIADILVELRMHRMSVKLAMNECEKLTHEYQAFRARKGRPKKADAENATKILAKIEVLESFLESRRL